MPRDRTGLDQPPSGDIGRDLVVVKILGAVLLSEKKDTHIPARLGTLKREASLVLGYLACSSSVGSMGPYG
jgi:hypothetical protein